MTINIQSMSYKYMHFFCFLWLRLFISTEDHINSRWVFTDFDNDNELTSSRHCVINIRFNSLIWTCCTAAWDSVSLKMTPLLSSLSLLHVHCCVFFFLHLPRARPGHGACAWALLSDNAVCTGVSLSKRKNEPPAFAGCFCCPVFHMTLKSKRIFRG